MSASGDSPSAGESARVAAAVAAQDWREDGHLSLRGLGLRALPDTFAPAASLRSLDISGNRLTELPLWLWELPHLERLIVAANRLRHLDGAISHLSALRELNVSGNRLNGLSPELAACQELRRLDMSGNTIEDISLLAQLPKLVVLDAARNRIGAISLPPSPVTLQSLDLSGNRLESLPASFGLFRALRRLDLSGNRLTSSALTVLWQLPLQELYIDDNRLTERVDPVGLPNLQRLSQVGNPVGQETISTDPGRRTVGERAADAVARHVPSDADPGRQYFRGPTPEVGVSLSVGGPKDAQRVVDLYYKRFADLPAKMDFRDGTTIDLRSLSRATALEFVDQHHAAGTDSRVSLLSPRGAAFLFQAIARIDHGGLVRPNGDSVFDVSQPGFTPLARVLNVALTDAEHRVLAPTATLLPLLEYAIRIDIGPVVEESIVTNPVPIRDEDLHASSTEGFWFDVVVASTDVDVTADVLHLFLPFDGCSWVCSCSPPEHICAPRDRQAYLYVPIRTRADHGAATLRCTIYNNNNAVQSVRVDFTAAPPGGEPSMIQGVIDFALADDVANTGHLQPRHLNVLANESADGTHKIVVNNGKRAIAADITELSAHEVLTVIRGKLKEITLGSDGRVSQYDEQNRKQTDVFVRDLGQLARLGSMLWQEVVPDRRDRAYLREQLAARSTIQITRVTPTVFPWALIYDIHRELDEKWTLCPFLEDWEANSAQLGAYPEACPHQDAHRANVLCPFGFWGFQHLLEQPPSVRHGVLRTQIRVAEPAHAAAGRSLALNAGLTSAHFKELEKCFSGRFDLVSCDSKAAIRAAFADPRLPLVYFYCHGKRAEIAGTQMTVPFLEIGNGDRIGPTDFDAWDVDDAWGPAHWAETAPLVFINGCETAKFNPEDVVTFVDALAGMDAAGAIGTEIPVTQQVAGEVALRFYRYFAGAANASVGTALYQTRIDLLRKGNVAGLAYTPFCSMDLTLDLSRSHHINGKGQI